jgi:hypothetical protein
MSMYTQLLEAACREHSVSPDPGTVTATPNGALGEVLRRRRQLDEGLPGEESAETVPAQLALQIGYDVALMVLARCVGIETEPGRFEQPQQERARLEHELRDKGISVEDATDRDRPVANQP